MEEVKKAKEKAEEFLLGTIKLKWENRLSKIKQEISREYFEMVDWPLRFEAHSYLGNRYEDKKKSFVEDLPLSKDSATIVRAIIGLAKSFCLAITAEGVEDKEQLLFLENAECDEIQGYYISMPLCLNDFRVFYNSRMNEVKHS